MLLIQDLQLYYNTHVIPLWPAINTSLLEFHLFAAPNFLVCFAVELTGCLSNTGKCIATV